MPELGAAVAAGALWSAAFVLLVLHAKRWTASWRAAALIAYPVFCALQVVLAKTLGTLGLLTTPAMLATYIGAVAGGGALYLWRRPTTRLSENNDLTDDDVALLRRVVLGGALVVLAGVAAFSLISPVFVWDTLAYHLPMVASYIQNGSLEPWPTQDLRQVYRVHAGELQLLNVALLSRSDAWIELPNVLAFGVCMVAAFELARVTLRSRALPYLVVALVLSAPQIVIGAVTAKNDLSFLALVLGAFYWTILAATAKDRAAAFAALAALNVGIAASTKVMGLNVLGAIGLLALVLTLLRRLPFRAVVAYTVTAALTLVVLVGDIYWANFARDAVPVGVAPNEVFFTAGLRNFVRAAEYYGWELPLRRLLVLQLFEHDLWHYGYLFPFLFVLGTVAAARQVMNRRARRLGLSALALMGAAIFLTVIAVRLSIWSDHRFMSWMVPVLAILAVSLIEHWEGRRVLVLATVAISFAVMHLFQTFTNETDGLFTRSATHLMKTGSLARYGDVTARNYRFMIDGFDVLERAAPDDSVLYVGSDDSWMYPAWGPRFTRRVRGVWNAADAAQQVTSGQYRFIVLEMEASAALREGTLDAAQREGYVRLADVEKRLVLERP